MNESMSYALANELEPTLARVHSYWDGLKRGDNAMRFWDDATISALGEVGDRALLIDMFENPLRFRVNFAGRAIVERYGASLAGKFLDEIPLHAPFDGIDTQCSETVKRRAPTYDRQGRPENEPVMTYGRMVLPLWGRGQIEMLLGAVE